MRRYNQKTSGLAPNILVMAVLLLAVTLSACEQKKEAPKQRPTPEVTVMTVRTEPVGLTTELPGRVACFRTAAIRPQVNGLIIKRLFNEGALIKKGQPLYEIDPAPFQAALDSAEAALDRARAQLPSIESRAVRYRELLADRAVSQQDYDDAEAALAQIKADIQYWKTAMESARINLGYCSITAPISGRIGRSSVTEGAIVTAYQPVALATIRQLDPIYVQVPQSRTAMLHLRKRLRTGGIVESGQDTPTVELLLEDGSMYSHKGSVQFSEVNVDESTGSVIMQILVANPDQVLLPGMFVRARIDEGVNPKGILIPQEAVSRDHKGAPYAMIVNKESEVELKMLNLDRAMGTSWLVASGLVDGDRVILQGRQFIRPGMPVRIAPAPAGDQGSAGVREAETSPKGDA